MRATQSEIDRLCRLARERGGTVSHAGPAPVVIAPEERLLWTEKQFQDEVIKLAKGAGLLAYHTWNSQRSEPGFPDTAICKPFCWLIYAELKTEKGRETPEQKVWRDAINATPGQRCFIWRPRDWNEIVRVLT